MIQSAARVRPKLPDTGKKSVDQLIFIWFIKAGNDLDRSKSKQGHPDRISIQGNNQDITRYENSPQQKKDFLPILIPASIYLIHKITGYSRDSEHRQEYRNQYF